MKLSRKAWNNVLLFSSLLMILLFSLSGKSKNEHSQLTQLLPNDAQITAISLERRLWKQNEDGSWHNPMSKQDTQVAHIIKQWQSLQLPIWPDVIGGHSPITRIQIQIKHLAEPININLFHTSKFKLISNWQGQLLQLSNEQYEQLIQPLLIQASKVSS